jgi:hypothetical protein
MRCTWGEIVMISSKSMHVKKKKHDDKEYITRLTIV